MQPTPPPGGRPAGTGVRNSSPLNGGGMQNGSANGNGNGNGNGVASTPLTRRGAPKSRSEQVSYLITTGVVGEIDKAIEMLLGNAPKNPMRFLAEYFTQRADALDADTAAPKKAARRSSKDGGKEALFYRLGGAWAVDPTVEVFYSNVIKDPELEPIFKNVNMGRLKAHQKAFVTFALGGPNEYIGKNMKEAHAKLKLSDEQFDRMAMHFSDALRGLVVNDQDVKEAMAVIEGLRADVVVPGESLYSQLGAMAITKALGHLFQRLQADPQTKAFFAGANIPRLEESVFKFLRYAYGEEKTYDTRALESSHKRLVLDHGLSSKHFELFAQYFMEGLVAAGVAPSLAEQARAKLMKHESSVLYKRIYDRIGGDAAVDAAVSIFYEKLMKDAILAPFFRDVDMSKQHLRQKRFLTYAFGGAPAYDGRQLEAAHRRLVAQDGLNDMHFTKTQHHILTTLRELKVAEEDVEEVRFITESVRDQVLCRTNLPPISLYETIASAALERLGDALYKQALKHDDFSSELRRLPASAQTHVLQRLLTFSLGGPMEEGEVPLGALKGQLTSVQFDQLILALEDTLQNAEIKALDRLKALEKARECKASVVRIPQSLFEKLGGDATLHEAVRICYDRQLADPTLRPFFKGVEMCGQNRKLKAYLTYAFGGAPSYTGKSLRDAHRARVRDMGLDESHFRTFVDHFAAALKELHVADEHVAAAAAVLNATKNDVLCAGEDLKPRPRTLFDRIGGEAAVDAAVRPFYERLLADPDVRPFFQNADIVSLREKQKAFLTHAFGGSAAYDGKSLSDAHRRLVRDMGLNAKHFDAVVGHLGAVLRDLGVGDQELAEAAGIANGVKDAVLCTAEGIVYRPAEPEKPSLFERIGGDRIMDAAVGKFYSKLMADARISPFFKGVTMEAQRNKFREFLAFAFGGPKPWTGKKMQDAHRRLVLTMGLNDTHFDALLDHLGATLAELNVPAEAMREASQIVESVRAAVLCKGEASLYERIGGAAAVDAAINIFYEKLFEDELLAPFFRSVDPAQIRKKQRSFLCFAFGGSTKYEGKALEDAHRRLVEDGLTDKHFDRVAQHFAATCRELNVPTQETEDALNIVQSVRDAVLCRTPAPKRSLFERIGGAASLEAVCCNFFDKVFSHATLAPFFQNISKGTQRKKVKLFLHFALGAAGEYDGPTMEKAHRRLVDAGLDDSHVDAFIRLLQDALSEEGVGPTETKEVVAMVSAVRDAVLCRSAKKRSLFERIGGESTVKDCVEKLYDRVGRDVSLDPFFDMVDMDKLKNMQRMFLTYAFGGAEMQGVSLAAAHKRSVNKGLNDVHFESMVEHLASTLRELGVGEQEISEATAVADSVRDTILGRVKRTQSVSSMKKHGTLFERIGGKDILDTIVDDFYDRIYADPLLKNFFGDTDMDVMREKQVNFLMFAFGAGTKYNGPTLEAAHRRLVRDRALGDSHFDAVVSHLKGSLKEMGVMESDLQEVLKIVNGVRADVLGQGSGKRGGHDDDDKARSPSASTRAKRAEEQQRREETKKAPEASGTAAAAAPGAERTSNKPLYEELGEDNIKKMVKIMYEKLLSNPRTMQFFQADHLDLLALRTRQKSFIKAIFGGENEYIGKDLNLAHSKLVAEGLNDDSFDAFVDCVRSALLQIGVSEQVLTRASAELEKHRNAVLGRSNTHYPNTLFHRVGGAGAIEVVVRMFYDKIRGDTALVRFFEDVSMEKLRRHQALFLGEALGSPLKYQGRAMGRGHANLVLEKGLNSLHGVRVVQHLESTLREAGVGDDDIATIMNAVDTVRGQIIPPAAKAEVRTFSLFKRVGGHNLMDKLVPEFVDRVFTDNRITAFFVGVDKPQLVKSLQQFMAYVMDSGTPYTGKTMRAAHKHLMAQGLNDFHVNHFFDILNTTMRDMLVADQEREEVMEKIRTFKVQVLGRNDASEASGGRDDMAGSDDEESELYQNIGGRSVVRDISKSVIEGMKSNENTKRFFVNVETDQLTATLAEYLGSAWGGPDVYIGKALRAAHMHLVADGLNDSHFDVFMDLLRKALEGRGLPKAVTDEAIELAEEPRDDVLNNAE